MQQQLMEDFERLDFDINGRAPDPELAAAFVELALAEPPDVTGSALRVSGWLGIHGLGFFRVS
jgi:hypothetical protein